MPTILYDWLNLTSKETGPDYFLQLLNMEDFEFETFPGAKGYMYRLYSEGISIHFGGDAEMGKGSWLEMSGEGCRTFEKHSRASWEELFDLVRIGEVKITRLDIAGDDKEGILNIRQICRDTDYINDNMNFVSRFHVVPKPGKPATGVQMINAPGGCSVQHGSKHSRIFIRIYDKAAEQNISDGSTWVRVEIKLTDERAHDFVMAGNYNLGKKYTGILNNYLRYVVPNEEDTNKRRWKTADYWTKFIKSTEVINFHTVIGKEVTVERLEKYLEKQCGNSIDTYLRLKGMDYFLKLIRNRKSVLNRNQRYLLKSASSGTLMDPRTDYQFDRTTVQAVMEEIKEKHKKEWVTQEELNARLKVREYEPKRLDKDVRDIVQAEACQA